MDTQVIFMSAARPFESRYVWAHSILLIILPDIAQILHAIEFALQTNQVRLVTLKSSPKKKLCNESLEERG